MKKTLESVEVAFLEILGATGRNRVQYAADAKRAAERWTMNGHVAVGKTQSLSGKRTKGKIEEPENIHDAVEKTKVK